MDTKSLQALSNTESKDTDSPPDYNTHDPLHDLDIEHPFFLSPEF